MGEGILVTRHGKEIAEILPLDRKDKALGGFRYIVQRLAPGFRSGIIASTACSSTSRKGR
uniref:Uncharacterized protein n=1 Tax=Candidatus Kentrum sp. FW TaxID=2126338 RepID=A0A450T2G0_9GAMM|nr:MAG: hypothetical protein BECKFW1821A_GA0114235_110611 [Candidatus Kentron sp. FW]